MLEQVQRTIEEYHMAKGGRLIVGLSGGADSVCLLHVLRQLVPRYGWDLQAVHIHHGLRGEEADRDAAFAHELCPIPWGALSGGFFRCGGRSQKTGQKHRRNGQNSAV